MDIAIEKQPLVSGGIYWTRSNVWVISTPSRIYMVTPASHTNYTSRQEATIDLADVTAVSVSVLEEDSPAPKILVLDSQSQLHLIASSSDRQTLPMMAQWSACTVSPTANGGVVAVGSMHGRIRLLEGLEEKAEFLAHRCAVTQAHWAAGRLVTCGADGTACVWRIGDSVVLETMAGARDWRPFTAVDGEAGCVVLARIGQAVVVDLCGKTTHYVDLPGKLTQTVVSCLYDPGNSRVFLGTYDCQLYQISSQSGTGGWQTTDSARLKEEVRKTIVRSFTTEFNMSQLVLRALRLSASGRYLVAVADDQTNWEVAKDGQYVTRVHFHPLFPWTAEWCQHKLRQLVMEDGQWRGQRMWELLDQCTTEQVEDAVEYLKALEVPNQMRDRRRLYMINYICCTATGSIESGKLRSLGAQTRGRAMDLHVLELCQKLSQLSTDHVARLQWAVSQLAYAEIADQLPALPQHSANEVRCPVCQHTMRLVSRLTACCDNRHVFDLCAVSLEILEKPGMAQRCDTCLAKKNSKLDDLHCPICQGSFMSPCE